MENTSESSGEMQLSRKEIFIALQDNLNCTLDEAYKKIENLVSEKFQCSYKLTDNMKQICHNLFYSFRTKWKEVKRTKQKFFKNYDEWLNVSLSFSNPAAISKTPKKKSYRLSSEFTSSRDRSKRRKTKEIRSSSSLEELSYATQMTLRASGKVDIAKVVKDVTLGSPTKAEKYRRSMESISETTLSSDSALLVLIEQKLSKSQYQGLRAVSKENNCKLYPPYKTVLQAKQKCYPSKTDITITDCSAEVKLQALLDHTVERILLTQNDVIKSLTSEHVSNMTLICKRGCDGTSGHSVYKQKFNSDDESKSDSNIFFTSLVPLQLISVNSKTKAEIVVWKNPRPSSPRFCRPIRLQFIHENTQDTVREVEYIKEQEKKLVPFQTVLDGKDISVSYKLAFTIIDGKVCNAVTSTSSTQHCYLCQATSKQFNDIDGILKREVDENNLCFGLSTLHAWICFFECCLDLSYKLDLNKWQARSGKEKKMIENRKKIIQKGFRLQLGFDQPKAGFGSSNDGNTARRFFENSTTSALITGVDENLIKRFHVLLQVISSGYEIDAQKFQEYAIATARKFIELYPWYYMPTSVHKILIHGPQIIASALLPIGQLSEDAQEASNKYIKRFREDFSRKSSRVKNMEDVFLRLLVTSDPYISSLRKLPQKKFKSLTREAIDLLVSPGVNSESCAVDNEDTSDEDSNDSDNDE